MDETSLKTIGIEGRKNIIQKFNVEKMCSSTYSEYKRILNKDTNEKVLDQ